MCFHLFLSSHLKSRQRGEPATSLRDGMRQSGRRSGTAAGPPPGRCGRCDQTGPPPARGLQIKPLSICIISKPSSPTKAQTKNLVCGSFDRSFRLPSINRTTLHLPRTDFSSQPLPTRSLPCRQASAVPPPCQLPATLPPISIGDPQCRLRLQLAPTETDQRMEKE